MAIEWFMYSCRFYSLDDLTYQIQEDYIKQEYEIGEVLTFFEEIIKPTLNSNEKEMVKWERK